MGRPAAGGARGAHRLNLAFDLERLNELEVGTAEGFRRVLVVAPHGATLEDGYRAAEVCDAMQRSSDNGSREAVAYRTLG